MNGVPWWFFHGLKKRDAHLESLDPGGKLARAIPTERIVGCVIHLAASTPEPGLVSHNMGARLILGEPGGENTARTRRIADALAAAGFEIVVTQHHREGVLGEAARQRELQSGLGADGQHRRPADREPGGEGYMVEIMREVLAIGRAVGVDANIDPEARIDMARALGPFKTSMLQDLEAGKRLEIDGLLAGTLEIARKAGVRAPFTESLFGLIRARAQSTGQYR